MTLTIEQAKELEQAAKQNDGRCDRCHRIIKIYRYPANKTLALILRKMAKQTNSQEGRQFDIADIGMGHTLWSQLSKLRFHGLIAKVKDENGKQKTRIWIITRKGWAWLGGTPIEKYAIVFNNTVLGHDGELISIYQAEGGMDYQEKAVSTPEANVIGDVRKPKKLMEIQAIYRPKTYGTDPGVIQGVEYTLKLERLQVGHPVKMLEPWVKVYKDIAAFQQEWRAV